MMKHPSKADWAALYGAAIAYKELAPWQWTLPDDLFAIETPRQKEVAFCSIYGAEGQEPGLAVFIGAEGYQGLRRLVADDRAGAQGSTPPFCSVSVTFLGREALKPEDRETVKDLGLRFRGRNAWPLFRSQVPEHLPWFLERGEAALLTTALRQAVDVAGHARAWSGKRSRRRGLILTRFFRHGKWQQDWREPPKAASPAEPSSLPDELRLYRIRTASSRRDPVWEVSAFVLPKASASPSGPPYLPTCVLAASPQRGLVGLRLIGPLPTPSDKQNALLEIMEESGSLPRQIVVPVEGLRPVVDPLAGPLGMSIGVSPSLPSVDEALLRVMDELQLPRPGMRVVRDGPGGGVPAGLFS
jgi:hypothetical protein